MALAVLAALVLALAWLVAVADPYQPGSSLGYNLGLVGGLLMLSLAVYPLRKRVRAMERLGRMESWFRYHIFAGIAGPLLVLFHSTFKAGSMNARIALYSMLLVAGSGIVGRFFYRKVHQGLYGRQLTLMEARSAIKLSMDKLGSVFALCPDIEVQLKSFYDQAMAPLDSAGSRVWRFITLRARSRRLAIAIRRDAKRTLRKLGKQKRFSRSELILSYRLAREQVDRFLDATVKMAQLAGWERLFSLWHVIHVPFLYLLAFSGIVHVIAVHMY